MNPDPQPHPAPKRHRDIAKELQNAQLRIVEHALVGFIEDVLGRVPSDEEILRESFHLTFAASPLAVYEKDGKRFSQYWCYGKKHLVALGFIDGNDPLSLYIVRVPEEEWPVAVKLYVAQHGTKTEGPA